MGLVSRERDTPDRRYVTARITPAGLELLARLDAPVQRLHQERLGRLGATKLRALVDLLEEARG
jgi:DNA-binding MarR family transcriptional regulator